MYIHIFLFIYIHIYTYMSNCSGGRKRVAKNRNGEENGEKLFKIV